MASPYVNTFFASPIVFDGCYKVTNLTEANRDIVQ